MKEIEFTPEQIEDYYGERTKNVGECFKWGTHYYQQRESDVLHCNLDGVINNLNVGYLNLEMTFTPIPVEVFDSVIRAVIYNLDIGKYWKQ